MSTFKGHAVDTIPTWDLFRGCGTISDTVISIGENFWSIEQEDRTDSMPDAVFHGRQQALRFENHPNEKTVVEWLKNGGLELIETIQAGLDIVWNGDNHVGVLSDEAAEALGKLEQGFIELGDFYELYDIDEWLGNLTADELGIHAGMPDEEIMSAYTKSIGWADDSQVVDYDENDFRSFIQERFSHIFNPGE